MSFRTVRQLAKAFLFTSLLLTGVQAFPADACSGLYQSYSIEKIGDRIANASRQDLALEKKGYTIVDLKDYVTSQETEAALQKLIQALPNGQRNLLDEKDVAWLKTTIGPEFVDKLTRLLEMHRKKISDVYSAEVAGEFTTKLALLRWTNGSSNLAFADRWHYDGFWFTIGTTLFGEGTNYSLADRHQEARWAQGFFPNHEISESSVAPALASIIYTARDRAMFYQAKSQTMPPLLHKGSEKFQPRLFLVQSLR